MPSKPNIASNRRSKASALKLRDRLEDLYGQFHNSERVASDPLGLVPRSLPPEDFELASFLIAGLSYGRVAQIQASSRALLGRLHTFEISPHGEGLARALKHTDPRDLSRRLGPALEGWVHRLNTAADLRAVIEGLSRILQTHGSLARAFQAGHDPSMKIQIENFAASLNSAFLANESKHAPAPEHWIGTGPQWFAPSPAAGGTSKRMMMWLRWMVRRDAVDPGTWREESLLDLSKEKPNPARLFVPVDTHIFQWAKSERITRFAGPSWKVVEEITQALREADPTDPVKYDFAICHAGMTEFSRVKK